MSATRQDIQRWIDEGKERGATHVIVALDTYDYDNYRVYVMPGQSAEDCVRVIRAESMQRVDEVYNLSLDIGAQLAERRAFHL